MKINIKISPETILSDIVEVNYSGETFGVYSGLSKVISGTTGVSSLTGLTVPIALDQTIQDIGYYTPFDGIVSQENSEYNFIFSSTTESPFTYRIYNTSSNNKKFLEASDYTIDWGDGTPKESAPYDFVELSHLYP